MNEAILKVDLHNKIEHADSTQLKEIYGLITNYFAGQDIDDNWDSLPEYRKEHILESLVQADAGLGTPARDVIRKAREKYGLNG